MSNDEIKITFQKEIDNTAISLLKIIRTGKANNPSFYSLMVFKIQQKYYMKRSDEDTYDMKYWKEKGWIDKKNTYYMLHSGNPIKVIMARTVGSLLALFFA